MPKKSMHPPSEKKNLRDGMLVSTAAGARGKHVSPEPLVADHVQDSCDVFAGRVA